MITLEVSPNFHDQRDILTTSELTAKPSMKEPRMTRQSTQELVDLSHAITADMNTYPGLPTPKIETHLSREAAEAVYGPGGTFHIGLITLCTNTGTYLDVPFHRFADGHDLSALTLECVADVDAVCLDCREQTSIDLDDVDFDELRGRAVLIRTDHASHWATDAYFTDHPHLTSSAAEALARAEVACVGIDSLNIDSTATGERPVHTTLLRAQIPIIEHLTGLDALPHDGFTFTAVPPKIEGAGTFTVRAFARILADKD
jgi:kynurenine formamidase